MTSKPSRAKSTPAVAHAPHPPLRDYYADEAGRRQFVRTIFDQTAADYDRVERWMAAGSGAWYRRQALLRAGLVPQMRVLDVAVGTGLVAREALAIVGEPRCVVGIDPSLGMLRRAAQGLPIRLVQAQAERLPFPDATFDFVSMGFALRHLSDLALVFAEFQRVLKPGGRICILEITRPNNRVLSWGLKAYMRGIVPRLARLITRHHDTGWLMRYYWDTIETCVPAEQVVQTLTQTGFSAARRHVELGIFSEYQAELPAR